MSSRFVIDSIVEQTTILVAQLATAKGIRAPLSHVADQVFLELANSIEAEGVPRKVAADMFGMALRSYQLKVQRLQESATARDQSLWEAIYDFVADQGVVQRAEVLTEFRHDDGAAVRSILQDLVDTGLVFQTGSRRARSYRAASADEVADMAVATSSEAFPWVVWIHLYRRGEQTVDQIAEALGVDASGVEESLKLLRAEGRVTEKESGHFYCDQCHIPRESTEGWEAAVIDHFQAVVVALCVKLRELAEPSLEPETVGGSTYSFDLHDDHPHREEVFALLQATRDEISDLATEVRAHNDANGRDRLDQKVTFYFGQSVVAVDDDTGAIESSGE